MCMHLRNVKKLLKTIFRLFFPLCTCKLQNTDFEKFRKLKKTCKISLLCRKNHFEDHEESK